LVVTHREIINLDEHNVKYTFFIVFSLLVVQDISTG
jgi:hypothetical protein